MQSQKYIGGSFAKNDSIQFITKTGDWEHYFPLSINNLNRFEFETGVDALTACLNQLISFSKTIYFPLHYCGDTINRFIWKNSKFEVKYYEFIDELPNEPIFILWNHFNGYCEPPSSLLENDNWQVIEDFVQAIYDLKKTKGIASFTSLRKWSEIDVSFLYISSLNLTQNLGESSYFFLKKKAEKTKFEWKNGNQAILEEDYLNEFNEAEEALDQDPEIYKANSDELKLMESIDWNKIKTVRIENTSYLKQELLKLKIDFIENMELFLMIKIENRDEIRQKLKSSSIFAPVHWLDSKDETLSKSLLSLPIDHRYTLTDMARIIKKLSDGISN